MVRKMIELHAWLDLVTDNEELVSNIMVWLSAHDHIYM